MRYVTRSQWGARAPKKVVAKSRPSAGVIIHHSVTPKGAPLVPTMREIQRQHMHVQGWFDFAYQEAVHDNGDVAEGRGFDVQSGATGQPWDRTHLTIVALGNYETDQPSAALIASLVERIVTAAQERRLVAGFTITAHRDHGSTACCGRFLYSRLPEIRQRVADALNPTPAPPPTPEPPTEEDLTMKHVVITEDARDAKGQNTRDFLVVGSRVVPILHPGLAALADERIELPDTGAGVNFLDGFDVPIVVTER